MTGVEAPTPAVHRAHPAATLVVGRANEIAGQAPYGRGHDGGDPRIDDPTLWAEIVGAATRERRCSRTLNSIRSSVGYSPDELVKSIASHRDSLLTDVAFTIVRMEQFERSGIG
jgi:hypothetical protein